MISKRIGLVLQGGGARGVFVAGATDAFLDNGLEFPYIIGTSAGALVGFNVVSKDRGRARDVIVNGMSDKRFASFSNFLKTGSYFGFDFLFGEMATDILPFNYKEFKESKITFVCGTVGVEDGLDHYFYHKDDAFFTAASASSSLPFISKPVEMEGHKYMDGGPVCVIPFRKAIEDGNEKIVVILTRSRDYRKKKMGFFKKLLTKIRYHRYPAFVSSLLVSPEVYNEDMEKLFELEKEGKAFIICPKLPPKVSRTEKDKGKLQAFYEEGYQAAAESLVQLKAFLGIEDE